MTSIVLVGALGRMGRAIEEAAAGRADVRIKARLDLHEGRLARVGNRTADGVYDPAAPGSGGTARGVLEACLAPGDVVVEFSSAAGAAETAQVCARSGAGLVSGSTGLDAAQEAAVRSAAGRVPVLRAANFSIGLMVLRRVLDAALAAAPREWDIEIVERHHRRKADSPSGTALVLANQAAAARHIGPGGLRHGREGHVGARPADEIGVHAVRGGSWVGDHAVLLAGEGEWIELRHVAQDRGAFARGAIVAAQFVTTARAGLYTLEDVVPAARNN